MYSFIFLILILSLVYADDTRIYAPFQNSGKSTCDSSTPRKDLWEGQYYDYLPKHLHPSFTAVHTVNSKDACYQQCLLESDCNAFAYYPTEGTSGGHPCTLYLGATLMCNIVSDLNSPNLNGVFTAIALNGYTTCSSNTCKKDLSAGKWVNCNDGEKFTAKAVTTDQECGRLCLAETGCRYFAFYPSGACDLFITKGGTCVKGTSKSLGDFYRFGSKGVVSPLEEEDGNQAVRLSSSSTSSSLVTGLSIGLGVAGFFVLALSVVIALLIKWGKQSKLSDDNSAQLL